MQPVQKTKNQKFSLIYIYASSSSGFFESRPEVSSPLQNSQCVQGNTLLLQFNVKVANRNDAIFTVPPIWNSLPFHIDGGWWLAISKLFPAGLPLTLKILLLF